MEMEGIGEVKAVKIKCIAELSARMANLEAENPDLPDAVFLPG